MTNGFSEGTPTVSIELDGKPYTLGWTWAAKRRLKEVLAARGLALTDQAGIAENLPAVLWASLDKESRAGLSVEDVEEMVNPANELEVATKLGELFKVSEPDADPNVQPVAAQTSTTGKSTSTSSAQLLSTT